MISVTFAAFCVYALLYCSCSSWPALAFPAYGCLNETSINSISFPDLIEATTEDLIAGLESKLFTSEDLVNVRHDLENNYKPC